MSRVRGGREGPGSGGGRGPGDQGQGEGGDQVSRVRGGRGRV